MKLQTEGYETKISYHRPNGKVSNAKYDTTPLDDELLWALSERVQHVFRKTPLVEIRISLDGETAHWEFDNWKSFLSTSQKLHAEDSDLNMDEWIHRINSRTGMKEDFLRDALRYYKEMAGDH
ncbi:hypothetical protein M9R32_10300 [Paenisporosarcina quisquiliarum]|uniref:Uncharacterized protein n=1 Tax=Paenisporosarcina quisquiliarum TaxID=365346 RepID=A0A9X3REI5_9BACL|nr:hypothetical protein [Paenisporosarcina quisquiliarum]MCZ8537572.1 hypothetical protein [Paenisporosarcina quisquiliarum]